LASARDLRRRQPGFAAEMNGARLRRLQANKARSTMTALSNSANTPVVSKLRSPGGVVISRCSRQLAKLNPARGESMTIGISPGATPNNVAASR